MKSSLHLKKLIRKSKSFTVLLMIALCIFTNSLQAQYCTTSYATGTGSGDYISLVEFVGTSLNNSSGAAPSPYYTFFPNTGSTTATLIIGTPYNLNVGGGTYSTCYIGIWGDWNQDGSFSSSEFMGVSPNVGGLATAYFSGSFIIPNNALTGQTRIRLRSSDTPPGPAASEACGSTNSDYGETEDYEITLIPLPACSGTPYAGNAISSTSLVCNNSSFDLDLIGNTLGSGITYQWQSSPTGSVWNNVGAPQNSWAKTVTNLTGNLMYRCITTCTSSALSDTSTAVNVNLNPFLNCYCLPNSTNFTVNCTNDKIVDFSIANVTGQLANCDANGFSDSTVSNYTTVNLNAGSTYTLTSNIYSSGFTGDGAIGAWIDYDHNGIFDSYEYTFLGSGPTGTYSQTLTIPFTSPGGSVRMRLMMDGYYGYSGTVLSPCSSNAGIGHIVDYKVNITAAPACSLTPNAGNAVSSLTTVCQNSPYLVDLNGIDMVSGITYQWQSSLDGSNWSNLGSPQNSTAFAVSSQSVATHYQCILTCTNSATSATSTPIVVNQNLLTECYCFPDMTYCSSVAIDSVSIANLNYSPTCNYTDGYTNYSDSIPAINLNAGQTYTLLTAVTTFSATLDGHVGAWIDYDQNGVFDMYEFTSVGSYTTGSISQSINVPFTAPGGNTRMRIKLETASSIYGPDPCVANGSAYGQTLDYLVNITPAPACTAAPNAGDAVASYSAICENITLKLDLQNNDQVSNMTYQWQSSADNIAWFNMGSSQTFVPYSIASQSVATYYRCITTCLNSSQSSTSTPVMVTQNPYTVCYCIPPPMVCTSDNINYVAFSSMTNTSTCSVDGYEDYTGIVPTTSVNAGQTYTLTTVLGYAYGEHVSAWIDYDHNGVFDNSEYTYIGANSGNDTIQNTISIPVTALLGNVRMRIRNLATGPLNAGDACISPLGGAGKQTITSLFSYGETEDYMITIMPPDCGNVIIPNTISATGASIFCSVQSAILDLAPALPLATGFSYNWMSSTGGSFVSEGISTSTTSINVMPPATTYYYCEIMCNSSSVLITDTISLVVDIVTSSTTSSDVTCFGLCNGSASVTTTSGVGPFVYSWSPTPGTTPSATGLCAGTYSVNVTDINGCGITETVTIIEPTSIIATLTQTNVSCNGLNDGMASVLASGGTSPYAYLWLPGGSTNSLSVNMAPGSYTAQIKDGNNCIINPTVTITEPGVFLTTISGSSSSICEQLEDTLTSTITGGVGPYTYSWNELPSNVVSTNATYEYTTSVGTHSYNLTVTDASNCFAVSNTLNISVNPSSNFSGMVTTNSTVPVAGRVILYKYLPFYTKFDSVAGQTIAPNGSFLFTSFTSGTYIIKAVPTATNLQVAYGDSAVNWKTAKQIIHGCAVNDVQDINVKALGTFTTTGTGLLSGHIREGNGFGQRMGTGFKPAAPGNPIGGIIVKGGKNPGGQMFVQTVTDTAGAYILAGLPANGAGESYFILVDIPGLDTNGTYDDLIINVATNQYTNLDFIVDSAKINPVSAVSVNDISAKEHAIKVFPNPASSKVTIQYILKDDSNVKIELYDIFGKSIKTILNQREQSMDQHAYSVPLDGLASGLYFIKININGAESTIKLSVTN